VSKSSSEPKAIGPLPGAFRIALWFLVNVGANKVLDCLSREEPFSYMVPKNGYELTCCDICPDQFGVPEILHDSADFNDRPPHVEVAYMKGLKRTWGRGRAVQEFARVAKTAWLPSRKT
jgi:hypothetical protein